ncbi:hypothetical protein BH18VER1_BH18VER1_15470 [soil metagenome]
MAPNMTRIYRVSDSLGTRALDVAGRNIRHSALGASLLRAATLASIPLVMIIIDLLADAIQLTPLRTRKLFAVNIGR